MNIASKYISREEYDREWEPRYQTLEQKYFDENGNEIGDSNEYNSNLERLDYQYAKAVSERIHQKLEESLIDCRNSATSKNYAQFEKKLSSLNDLWKDFNTSFHYKMNGRMILERD